MHYQENSSFLELLDKAQLHYSKCLPFVLYRKPYEQDVRGLFQQDAQLHFTRDYEAKGFVFAPYKAVKNAVLIKPDELYKAEYIDSNSGSNANDLYRPELSQKLNHLRLIKKGLDQISKAKIRKVVLSRKIEIQCTKDPIAIFLELLALYPKAFCYFWYHPNIGLWLGASPERLLQLRGTQLTTMALAGTKKANDEMQPDWGDKELQEQVLVTDYIKNTLSEKLDRMSVSEVKSLKAGSLWHLKTTIKGTISDASLKDIIKALHPTPAVCGLPLRSAQNFVDKYEGYDREYYTGFLGELNLESNNTSHLYVNLRCLQIRDNTAILYVGGGITKDSNPECEWQETVDKAAIVSKALFNFKE